MCTINGSQSHFFPRRKLLLGGILEDVIFDNFTDLATDQNLCPFFPPTERPTETGDEKCYRKSQGMMKNYYEETQDKFVNTYIQEMVLLVN